MVRAKGGHLHQVAPVGGTEDRSTSHVLRLLVFILITSLVAGAALLIYPRIEIPPRAGPIVSWIETSRTVVAVELEVRSDGSSSTSVVVRAYAEGSVGDGQEEAVDLSLLMTTVPAEMTTCVSPEACSVHNEFSDFLDGDVVRGVTTGSAEWEQTPSVGEVVATLEIDTTSPSPGLYCEQYACRGTSPQLLVGAGVVVADGAFGRARLQYPDLHDYEWDSRFLSVGSAGEVLNLSMPIGRVNDVESVLREPLNGDNVDGLQAASTRTFVAGALVGLAGGTLVASVEAAISWAGSSRRRRQTG